MKEEFHIWNERWRLAALSRDDMVKAGLWATIVALVYVLFHFQGNTTDIVAFGRSAILWMVNHWNDDSGNDYSYGWLIPFGSLAVIWLNRDELLRAPRAVSRAGMAVLVLALLLHWLGAKAQQTRLSLMALVLLTWAVPFYFCGWAGRAA